MPVENQYDKNLSVYWDYEAAQLNPKAVSGYQVVRQVRSALHSFGVICSFRIYHDSSDKALSNLRAELCSSGVTLIDCPSNGRREAATKMMIVDIIAYAWDHPAPQTIVIVSGDSHLGYMIGTLRMRKYEVILISPNGTHGSLTNQATINLDWTIDGRRTDMDDACGGKPSPPLSPQPPSPRPPSPPHLPPSPHQLPSPSFPSLSLPATSGFFSHYRKSTQAQEIDPPMIELQGMPTARGRQNPTFSHPHEPHRFDIFGDLGGSYPSPSVSHAMFGLGDGRSQSQPRGPARQVRSDSAPPGTSINPPASPPDNDGFGRIPSSAKGKSREFPITEPEDIGLQSPLTAKVPKEPRMAEEFFSSMPPPPASMPIVPLTTGALTRSSVSSQDSTFSVIQFPPSSTLTSAEPVNADSDNTTERGKSPAMVIITQEFTSAPPRTSVVRDTEKVPSPTPSLRQKEASTKDSLRTSLPDQPRLPEPVQTSPTPPPSQRIPPPKKNKTPNAQAGPSSATSKSHKHVPPHFQVLMDILRQHGGCYNRNSLPNLLLLHDPAIYKQAQVSKYKQYIAAAVKEGLVREVIIKNQGLCISLTEGYA